MNGVSQKTMELASDEVLSERYIPRIVNIGTANPPTRYQQTAVADLFDEVTEKVKKLFRNSHIKYRYLYMPDPGANGKISKETNQELINKHLRGVLEIGRKAIEQCLSAVGLDVSDIDGLVCVSSTGYLCPGISAYMVREMKFRSDVHRLDILGMGCSAGLNGLMTAYGMAKADPKKKVIVLCIEICSAAYVNDGTLRTAVVNSLFGDGAAAVLVAAQDAYPSSHCPQILGFESLTIADKLEMMKFELMNDQLSFYLARETPYLIGVNIERPVYRLLDRHGIKKRDVKHWVVHSGGKKVLDTIKYSLGLRSYDIRHTSQILEEYGNMSSASVYFAMKRMQSSRTIEKGDLGVAIAMGPGVAIETALLKW